MAYFGAEKVTRLKIEIEGAEAYKIYNEFLNLADEKSEAGFKELRAKAPTLATFLDTLDNYRRQA